MDRRNFLMVGPTLGAAALVLTACSATVTKPDAEAGNAAKRREIDTAATATLSRLFTTAPGSKDLADRAAGILIFPRVLSGGLVVGGEYGDGVLRAGGRDTGYYRIIGGSFGWQAGAQSQAIILMFLTPEALDRFRKSNGWTVGADATVSVANVGASGQVDTNTVKQSVVAFALTNVGLYAGLKIEGAKITRLDM